MSTNAKRIHCKEIAERLGVDPYWLAMMLGTWKFDLQPDGTITEQELRKGALRVVTALVSGDSIGDVYLRSRVPAAVITPAPSSRLTTASTCSIPKQPLAPGKKRVPRDTDVVEVARLEAMSLLMDDYLVKVHSRENKMAYVVLERHNKTRFAVLISVCTCLKRNSAYFTVTETAIKRRPEWFLFYVAPWKQIYGISYERMRELKSRCKTKKGSVNITINAEDHKGFALSNFWKDIAGDVPRDATGEPIRSGRTNLV